MDPSVSYVSFLCQFWRTAFSNLCNFSASNNLAFTATSQVAGWKVSGFLNYSNTCNNRVHLNDCLLEEDENKMCQQWFCFASNFSPVFTPSTKKFCCGPLDFPYFPTDHHCRQGHITMCRTRSEQNLTGRGCGRNCCVYSAGCITSIMCARRAIAFRLNRCLNVWCSHPEQL